MVEMAMYYDVGLNKWCLAEDAAIASSEIEELPVVVIVRFTESNILCIWCGEHNVYEKIEAINGMNFKTKNNCHFYGLPALVNYNRDEKNEHFSTTVRWRHTHKKGASTVFLGCDIANVNFVSIRLADGYHMVPRLGLYKYENYICDIANGSINSMNKYGYLYGITAEINEITMKLLQDTAGEVYGLRPSITDANTKIEAFLFRPYDTNCYELQGYFGNMDFLPRDHKNAYHVLCDKLEISPPKSLKKIYAKNPFAIILYRALLELGFKDYNLMLPFLSGTQIGTLDFRMFLKFDFPFFWDKHKKINDDEWAEHPLQYYPESSDMISQREIDELLNGGHHYPHQNEWERLNFFVSWMMREKGEIFTAHRLLHCSKAAPHAWEEDIYSMIYHRFDRISAAETKAMFITKGLTHALHDMLVEEYNRMDYGHQLIEYDEHELNWECTINGYNFKLPTYTDEIGMIGKKLCNCVASYIGKTVNKQCRILSVYNKNEPVACIEIKGRDKTVNQALGYHNKVLSGELLHVVNFWLRKMSLEDKTDHLQDDEYTSLPAHYFSYNELCG